MFINLPTLDYGKDTVSKLLNRLTDTPFFKPKTIPQGTENEDLDELIDIAGYSYDPKQDIFISRIHPWQRSIGYCRLFDELAPILGMIIDCEPVKFEYQGKKWFVGLWKGQYDLVSGGEIGFYKGVLNIPGISDIFYRSVDDKEMLKMTYTLKKNGETLFIREGNHLWLTGFKLGEFSEPSELSMDITIDLKNSEMRDALLSGLRNVKYTDEELQIDGNSVSFTFDVPHTAQPITRTKITDWIIQRKNRFLCEEFEELTGSDNTIREKVKALEEKSPRIYKKLVNNDLKKFFEIWAIPFFIVLIVLYLISVATDTGNDSF